MCLPQVVVPPLHSMLAVGRCNLYKKVWRETLKLSAWDLKALRAMSIEWISPKTNLPFDSATTYPIGSEERWACSATLEHYLEIGSVLELPPKTSDGLWSRFFLILKKGTGKMRGCVDLRKPNSCIQFKHFEMEGLHTIPQLIRQNNLSTEVDLNDFYMHFLIGKSDCRYMRFM